MCSLLKGRRPRKLGVKDGKFLAAVRSSPNNVSSQANKELDASHYVAPLPFKSNDSPKAAIQKLVTIVDRMDRTKIVTEESNYLHVEFTSKLLGYCDDVEFYAADDGGIVDVRSASRLGYGDGGVNRRRVEAIRRKWEQLDNPGNAKL